MLRNKFVLIGILIFVLSTFGIWAGLPELALPAKGAFTIFIGAIIAWSLNLLDATLVAVLAAVAMSAAGLTKGKLPLHGLGDPFIMFVIAGFMLGAAYKTTGLSERIAHWFAVRSHSIGRLFYLLTTALVLLSFVVPSTSARAAVLMPVYVAIVSVIESQNIRKALAILFPAIIVLSCVTSYLGAGANLMTADFIAQFAGTRIGYLDWMLMGGPFGIASCFLSTWVILRLFTTPDERRQQFRLPAPIPSGGDTTQQSKQWRVLAISALMIVCWMTEQWHGVDTGMVALCGALLLCAPNTGVMGMKQALKEVEWPLVVFMAATLELSQGLVNSGAVAYLTDVFSSKMALLSGPWVMICILILALLSHLVIHSRTARAAVMMPVLIPLGIAAGQSGLLVAFFSNAAMGYCLTLPICAKPVALFSTAGGEGYSTGDLLRLSAWLLPLHLLLLLLAVAIYG